jgi:hypothetical protein
MRGPQQKARELERQRNLERSRSRGPRRGRRQGGLGGQPRNQNRGALIAAFDTEHFRAQGAITAIYRAGEQLKLDLSRAAKVAVQAALKDLNADIEKASQVLTDLQGLSLWRASLQHLAVAVVARPARSGVAENKDDVYMIVKGY